jgi:hypothetical protein
MIRIFWLISNIFVLLIFQKDFEMSQMLLIPKKLIYFTEIYRIAPPMPKRIFFPLIFIFSIQQLFAGTPLNVPQLINHSDWNFAENKGQLKDISGQPLPEIKYYGRHGGVSLYCKAGMISFVFSKVENDPGNISEANGKAAEDISRTTNQNPLDIHKKLLPSKITSFRADLILSNANAASQIVATGQQDYSENYYTTGDANHGITNVHTFKTITYKNIYDNIDLVLHAKETGLKYEFIVHPGGRVNDIQLTWNGLEKLEMLKDGGIHYAFGPVTMDETSPGSFLSDGKSIKSTFLNKNSKIQFSVSGYNKASTLIIDPSLSWGTYFGGSNDDEAYGSTIDAAGNIYITGRTASKSGIATSGAYLTSITSGGVYAFLAKFNSSGTLKWATYYGGGAWDEAHAVSIGASGNLFITGKTLSYSGIATSGAYQTKQYGDCAFLAEFSSSGSLSWGTYFGGGSYDQGLGICNDASGNVYITGSTESTSHLATSGAYQTSLSGSGTLINPDAFLAKFSSAGSISWATYYGGTDWDYATGLKLDSSGIYLVGNTVSNNGIATSNAYQSWLASGVDAFLAKFNTSGNRVWATYYGGKGHDFCNGLSLDNKGNIYITGHTSSSNGIASKGAYQTSYSGGNPSSGGYGGDVFLAKFNKSGNFSWGTYYGGPDDDLGQAIIVDPFENIIISGNTASTNGIATSYAYKNSNSGGTYGYDAFVAKFTASGSLSTGTYYGGSGDDYGTTVLTDANGNAYLAGYTSSNSGIITSGAYQTSYGGGNDAFIAKFNLFALNDAGIDSIKSPVDSVCPVSQPIKVHLQNYGSNSLSTVSIGWSINDTLQTSYSWSSTLAYDSATTVTIGNYKLSPGLNKIKAWTSKPNGVIDSMPGNDTVVFYVPVKSLPVAKTIHSTNICGDSAINIGAPGVSGSTYSWTSSPSGITSNSSNPYVDPKVTTTYTLTETHSGCTQTHSLTLTVGGHPLEYDAGIDSIYTLVSTMCEATLPMKVDLQNYGCKPLINVTIGWSINGVAQTSYKWKGLLGSGNSAIVTLGNYNFSTGKYAVKVWSTSPDGQTDSLQGNDTSRVNVVSNTVPQAKVGKADTICYGAPINLGSSSVSGNKYSWTSNPKGFVSDKSNPVTYAPYSGVIMTYYLTETVIATGCAKSDSVKVTVDWIPDAKVGKPQTICEGDLAKIGDLNYSGTSFSWSSNPKGFTSTTSNPTVYPHITTTYILTETNPFTGCFKTDSVTITVLPTPKKIPGSKNYICMGSSISIGTTAVSGHTYSWICYPGTFYSTSPTVSVSPTVLTTYSLTETLTSTGCSATDTFLVYENPLPTVNAGSPQTICYGSSASIGATAVSGHTYNWVSNPTGFSSISSNPSVSPLLTSYFILTDAITATGCYKKDSVKITVNPPPASGIGSQQSICYGTSTTIGQTAVSGYVYNWTSNNSAFSATSANPTVSPLTTTYYRLKETLTATGCTRVDSVKVTVKPEPTVIFKNPVGICAGSNDTIKFTISDVPIGQNWTLTYRKGTYTVDSIVTGTGSGDFRLVTSPLSSTIDYSFHGIFETSGSLQCFNLVNTKLTINVQQIPSASIITYPAVCPGGQAKIGILVSNVDSGQQWSIEYFKAGSSSDSFMTGIGGGNFYLVTAPISSSIKYSLVSISTVSGIICSNGLTDTKIIKVNPVPFAFAGYTKTVCASDSVTIGAAPTSGCQYHWTSMPSGFLSSISNPIITPSATKVYYLTVTNPLTGCHSRDSVKINVNPRPTPGVGSAKSICYGKSSNIGLTAITGHSYKWTSDPVGFTSTASNPNISPTKTTYYKLTETVTVSGCSDSDSVQVTVNPLPNPIVTSIKSICKGDSITLGTNAITGHTYSWSAYPGSFTATLSNPVVAPKITTVFTLTETISATGCSKTDSGSVTVYPLPNPKWYTHDSGQTNYFVALDSVYIKSSYRWDFGDGVNDSVSGYIARHLYQKNKNYEVKLKIKNTHGCINEFDSTITVTVSGIDQNHNLLNLSIYPNPFQSFTTIQYRLINKSKIQIGIFDMTGKEVGKVLNGNQNPGQYQLDINAEKYHLQPGIYLLKFMLDDAMITNQLIKF